MQRNATERLPAWFVAALGLPAAASIASRALPPSPMPTLRWLPTVVWLRGGRPWAGWSADLWLLPLTLVVVALAWAQVRRRLGGSWGSALLVGLMGALAGLSLIVNTIHFVPDFWLTGGAQLLAAGGLLGLSRWCRARQGVAWDGAVVALWLAAALALSHFATHLSVLGYGAARGWLLLPLSAALLLWAALRRWPVAWLGSARLTGWLAPALLLPPGVSLLGLSLRQSLVEECTPPTEAECARVDPGLRWLERRPADGYTFVDDPERDQWLVLLGEDRCDREADFPQAAALFFDRSSGAKLAEIELTDCWRVDYAEHLPGRPGELLAICSTGPMVIDLVERRIDRRGRDWFEEEGIECEGLVAGAERSLMSAVDVPCLFALDSDSLAEQGRLCFADRFRIQTKLHALPWLGPGHLVAVDTSWISVLDSGLQPLAERSRVGLWSRSLVDEAERRLVVLDTVRRDLQTFSLPALEPLAQTRVARAPMYLILDPARDEIVLSHYFSGRLERFRAATLEPLGGIDVGPLPRSGLVVGDTFYGASRCGVFAWDR